MIKLASVIVLAVICVKLYAQTEVSGSQFGTWSESNSPYHVIGDLLVPTGASLTIEAGVDVIFQGQYSFEIEGTLNAQGTVSDSIIFTSINSATTWSGLVFNYSDDVNILSYCRIENGSAIGTDFPSQHGGGIKLLYSEAEVSNCIFENNSANSMGGAIYGLGTGSQDVTYTRFVECIFIGNHAGTEGGAVKLTADGSSQFIDCEFIENSCDYGGGAIMFYSAINTEIIQCLFLNNSTTYAGGGAIYTLGDGNDFSITNCTFYGNEAINSSGGAISLSYSTVAITNSIIYNNIEAYDIGDNLYLSQAAVATVNNTNLSMPSMATVDNYFGENNIEVNPLFVDETNFDLHLSTNSECIDAGVDVGLSFNGNAPDMGCYETDINDNINTIFASLEPLHYSSPNPFTSNTNISYQLERDRNVDLSIYDLLGKKIVTLVNEHQNKGSYQANWNGTDSEGNKQASGIYFYKLNNEKIGKMIKR